MRRYVGTFYDSSRWAGVRAPPWRHRHLLAAEVRDDVDADDLRVARPAVTAAPAPARHALAVARHGDPIAPGGGGEPAGPDRAREQAAAIDGVELGPLRRQGPRPEGERARFWHWVDDETPATRIGSSLRRTKEHVQTFREAADELDVIFLHYDHLKADLEGQMRQLARRLGIEVDERRWPHLVRAATFESMRSRADVMVPGHSAEHWVDPAAFFSRGTSGQWRELLDDDDLARYAARVRSLASDDLIGWMHSETVR